MSVSKAVLTDYEVSALANVFNFADGHARYSFIREGLFEKTSRLPMHASTQEEMEYKFAKAYFGLASQERVSLDRTLYNPSASLSIEIVANYLRLHHLSVALLEPVFDNLADIIKRHDIGLKVLKEENLYKMGVKAWIEAIDTDALFLVLPNNPTGCLLSKEDFCAIVEYCQQTKKLLILDFSFRFYAESMSLWDQYEVLEESGIRYVAIGDTGKTWPTLEIKVSSLTADSQTFPFLRSIYRDLFICSSPFALALLAEFMDVSRELGLEKTVLSIIESNRSALQRAIAQVPLSIVSLPYVSVSWIEIADELNLDDLALQRSLETYKISVLPGRHFFWSQRQMSSKFIRVALLRDPEVFARGAQQLEQALSHILAGPSRA